MVKMQSFLIFTGLLVLSLVLSASTTSADKLIKCCIPHEQSYWIFPRRTDKDAVVLSRAVSNDLTAFTLCMFVRDDPDENSSDKNTPFSYASPEKSDAIALITSPSIGMLVAGDEIHTELKITDGNWHQICFTWENSKGRYQLYMDGNLKNEGHSLAKDSIVPLGGTAVLGQDQDTERGGFNLQQAFVGHLAEVNLWDTVLPESDIIAQRSNCHIPDGSVIRSEDFKNSAEVQLQGGVQVVCG